jgi:hypothetical protein
MTFKSSGLHSRATLTEVAVAQVREGGTDIAYGLEAANYRIVTKQPPPVLAAMNIACEVIFGDGQHHVDRCA